MNSVDSAGDKIESILKTKKSNCRVSETLMYMVNFEIWGMYEGEEKKNVVERRNKALNSINSMTSKLLFLVKEL